MKKILLILLIFIISVSCGNNKKKKNNDVEIELPDTKNPVELNQWAFVKYKYTKLRQDPIAESKIIYYMESDRNRGTIAKIIRKENELRKFDNKFNYWYYIDYDGIKGWVFGSFIESFNTYEEAVKKCDEALFYVNPEKE